MNRQPHCFVAMPFRPELHYFFLFVRKYLQEKHGIHVERGDDRVLTKPIMDKVREQILEADVVIGDITFSNPNVFYELGIAHAHGKPVIFLTQDSPSDAPVDVRHFESIQYNLASHDEFLVKLDSAIQNVFVDKYRKLHEDALEILNALNIALGSSHLAATLDTFQARVMRVEQIQDTPKKSSRQAYAEFLLPRILAEPPDLKTMQRLMGWVAAFE